MEAVIDPVGSTIVGYIPSGACRHGGAWADFDVRVVPEGLDKETIGVERNDEGEYVFVLDPKKVQARLDAQWASVRTQQRQKLYESDWTCSVIDPPPEILAQRDRIGKPWK